MAKVFLSHKSEDGRLANSLAERLKLNGLEVLSDEIDPQLEADGPELARYVHDALGESTQVLMMLTDRTMASWWVPLEIGAACERHKFITTFVATKASLPTYAKQWPHIRGEQDINAYCSESLRIEQRYQEKLDAEHAEGTARAEVFREFHENLRNRLEQ